MLLSSFLLDVLACCLDVSTFILDKSCLDAVAESSDGAKKVAMSFMHRNAMTSRYENIMI